MALFEVLLEIKQIHIKQNIQQELFFKILNIIMKCKLKILVKME